MFCVGTNQEVEAKMDNTFKRLCAQENDGNIIIIIFCFYIHFLVVGSKKFNILGRTLEIEKCCGRVADMHFNEVRISKLSMLVFIFHELSVVQKTIECEWLHGNCEGIPHGIDP